ncbi:MAG: hypothetical protein EOO16_26225, partial [Chitinophagaceae bacterium]
MFRNFSKRVRRFWASFALLSVEMMFVMAVFFVALVGFAYLVRRVFVLENNTFDQQVFDYLEGFVTP